MLQLADLVSYAVFRRYERGDTRLLDKIIHKFDSQDHVIHGLSHVSFSKPTCTCPGCLSKRLGGMVKAAYAAQTTSGGVEIFETPMLQAANLQVVTTEVIIKSSDEETPAEN